MTRDFDDESRDRIDEKLAQLLAEASQHPEKSRERQRPLRTILNDVVLRGRLFDQVIEATHPAQRAIKKQQFIWVMQQSGGIFIPQWIVEHTSIEDRADLLSDNWLWFCETFERYIPEKASPVTLFNRKLRFQAIDLYAWLRQFSSLPLDQKISDQSDSETFADAIPSPDPDPYSVAEDEVLRERIQSYLAQSEFVNLYVSESCRTVHCRSLLTDFLLIGMDWKEIYQKHQATQDEKLQEKIRRCYRERCLPRLRSYLNLA